MLSAGAKLNPLAEQDLMITYLVNSCKPVLMIRIENYPDIGFSIRNLMTFPLIMYRIFD